MRKIIAISLFVLFATPTMLAQKSSDSLVNQQIEANYSIAEKFLYRNIDSTRFYLWKCYQLSSEINDLNTKLGLVSQLINSDGYHFNLNFLRQDIEVMDSLITHDPAIDTLIHKEAYTKFLITNKGNYYYKLNNLPKAKFYFENLLSSLDESKIPLSPYDKQIRYSTIEFLASIANKEGKYDLAKSYYVQIIQNLEKTRPQGWERRIVGVKESLSRVLMNEKLYEKAKNLQLESLNHLKSLGNDPSANNIIKNNYVSLIKNYLEQDSLDTAMKYLEESKKWYTENDPFQKKLDILAGDIFTKQNEYDKAESFYQSALAATKAYRNQQKHQDVAFIYAKLGNLYDKQNLFHRSANLYQKGLQQLSLPFESDQLTDNPDPSAVFSKLQTVRILRDKLKTLKNLYYQEGAISDLHLALKTSYSLVETLDALKPEFESKVDKQFLISEMYPAFHEMVKVAFLLYDTAKEQKYIQDAFYFMEKSKSILLLEATRNSQATSFGDIPENIIDKEQQYRANIIHLEKKIFNQKENTDVSDSLFRLKNKYYDFISKIEQEYPKYYDLKYNNEVNSIENTMIFLGNKALLNFFMSDEELFLISIEKNNIQFYKIPFDESMQNICSRYFELVSRLDTEELPEIYRVGNKIYKAVLEKPLVELASDELIVVPDGVFNYIPFESLSLSDNAADFLIKKYQISYANSSTVLNEQTEASYKGTHTLVAYAPHFGNQKDAVVSVRSDLGPLLFNTEEAKAISNYFNGKAITGKEASLRSFKNNVKQYNILHFATHAAANDQFPDYSYLAFASEEQNSDFLFVKDLYAYNLDVDLVTLSACQTGLGKLQRGEGMLSLARGFAYAGARSMVTTLWKINDQTTAALMKDFYKGLSQSLPKDQALREAKLSYLTSVEDEFLQHPYYWSGFMMTGNTMPLVTHTSIWWWLLLLLIPLVYLVLRKSKKN